MKKIHFSYIFAAIALIVFGGVILTQQGNRGAQFLSGSQTATSTQAVAKYQSQVGYEQAIIDTVDKVSPAIVSITISKNVPVIENCPVNPFANLPPEFQQFFGGDNFQFNQPCQKGTKMQDIGGGSGFIVSADGMIVTNKHVVSDKDASYTVFTNDGKKYKAKVLARDPLQDLAIIKIEGSSFPTLPLADSDGIRLGQTVIAIGNALGEFRNTVSVGIVSGLARNITASGGNAVSEDLEGVIQTDAAINPGNSGGPLVNLRGEVIGINSAVVSGANSIGFALPINNVKRDINSVKMSGKITASYLGVHYILLTEEIAKRDNIKVTEGALIRGDESGPAVIKGSPADKAGVLAEDVITHVNGVKIDSSHSLVSLIQRYNVGDKVALTVQRGDRVLSLNVVLEERK